MEPRVEPARGLADLIVQDAEGKPVLLVELKSARLSPSLRDKLVHDLLSVGRAAPFAAIVDAEEIHLYGHGNGNEIRHLCQLPARDVLEHYDPELGKTRVFEPYLATLIEAWLNDVAYQWKSQDPPGRAELERVGLAKLLAGGAKRSIPSKGG